MAVLRELATPSSRRQFLTRCLNGAFALAAWVIGRGLVLAETAAAREYQLKAVFLLNFARFTEWPPSAFENPNSPLIIATLGEDPFGGALEETVKGESVNGRPLAVVRFPKYENITKCHILFICESEAARLSSILADLEKKPILMVSDMENFALRGGMIRFLKKGNKLGLRVNIDSLKASQLTVSSKLLRAAELVGSP